MFGKSKLFVNLNEKLNDDKMTMKEYKDKYGWWMMFLSIMFGGRK